MLCLQPLGWAGCWRASRGSIPSWGLPWLCQPVGRSWFHDQPSKNTVFYESGLQEEEQGDCGQDDRTGLFRIPCKTSGTLQGVLKSFEWTGCGPYGGNSQNVKRPYLGHKIILCNTLLWAPGHILMATDSFYLTNISSRATLYHIYKFSARW